MQGRPVQSFPLEFSWQEGDWVSLFDLQVAQIKADILRARLQGKLIIYLSCPISSRGGGYSGTNIEITEFTRIGLLRHWGTGFWILNPANYQMESRGGSGLIHQHAKILWGDEGKARLAALVKNSPAKDGDYMRMWTRVLVEDNASDNLKNLGGDFDGFYFLGPADMKAYFLASDNGDLTASIEDYFSRKFTMDADFKDYFSVRGITWGAAVDNNDSRNTDEKALVDHWQSLRHEFFKFYSLKAGVNYSLGSHDEWNIWLTLNQMRVKALGKKNGIPEMISAFFEGRQVTPADFVTPAISGYESVVKN